MRLNLQVACSELADAAPAHAQFESWASAAVAAAGRHGRPASGEVTIRVVGRAEMTELNRRYRGKDEPTDVLAFAFDGAAEIPVDILGDVVICAPVMLEEAARRGIAPANHWAHLTVHGVLHLCGFDHAEEAQAREMESLEREILAEFGIILDAETVAAAASPTGNAPAAQSPTR